MLRDPVPPPLSEFDRMVYSHVISRDHYLAKVLRAVPWDDFHNMLVPALIVDWSTYPAGG
jgi:hypothetical protein